MKQEEVKRGRNEKRGGEKGRSTPFTAGTKIVRSGAI